MYKIKIVPAAQNNLKDIWKYTAETWGEKKADSYLNEIKNKILSLSENPQIGRPRPEIKNGYKSLGAGKHLVFYFVADDYVYIIGVLHTKMDATRWI